MGQWTHPSSPWLALNVPDGQPGREPGAAVSGEDGPAGPPRAPQRGQKTPSGLRRVQSQTLTIASKRRGEGAAAGGSEAGAACGDGETPPREFPTTGENRGRSGSLADTNGILSRCHARRCKQLCHIRPKVHGHHQPSSGHPRSRARATHTRCPRDRPTPRRVTAQGLSKRQLSACDTPCVLLLPLRYPVVFSCHANVLPPFYPAARSLVV